MCPYCLLILYNLHRLVVKRKLVELLIKQRFGIASVDININT